MVLSVTAPLWGDISDRSSRVLGIPYGLWTNYQDNYKALNLHENLALITTNTPWWEQIWRGRVLCQDDFEGTLKWRQSSPTISKASDATFVHDGVSSMKFVTGGVAGAFAAAELFVQGSENLLSFATVEFYWALTAAADATPRDFYFTWVVEDYAMNASYMFGIRYWNYEATVLKRKMQYWNNAGAWTDIPPPTQQRIRITEPQFNHWMLMIRRSTVSARWEYAWIFVNDRSMSLNKVQGQAGAYTRPSNTIAMGCTTDIAAVTTAYVDDFTLSDQVGYGHLVDLNV